VKQKLIRKVFRGVAILFVAVLLGSGPAACQTNRTTGAQQFNMISMDQEIQMGREADREISESMGIYPDEKLQKYVSEIGLSIAAKSEWPELPWSFKVIDDATVNAFALPGGFIYVTRGILAHFNSEAQLAGVLGHEIGHVTARHSSVRMSKAQITQLGVGLAMVLEPRLQSIAPLAGAGMQIMFLSFSREDERDADKLGVRYMAEMGYNPETLIAVMETLGRVSEAGGEERLPQWLASHPNPENRQENIRGHIKDLGKHDFRHNDDPNEFLDKVDNIVYGGDPREGFTRDGVFYHPKLKFSVKVPTGWTVINRKQAVIAVGPKRDASVQLTMSGEKSIEAASRKLFGSEEVQGSGTTKTRINDLAAGIGPFKVKTEQGPLDGTVAFIDYDGHIYQLMGYSASGNWAQYRETVNDSLRSFNRLTDPKYLDMKPMRIDLATAKGEATLQDFYNEYYKGVNAAVSIDEIALLNQLEPKSPISAGTKIKMVKAP
jgi:predicted Zn-dependent protease